MTLKAGELVLIRMQFHESTGSKIRPALVVLDTGDEDFIAAPVTSQRRIADYDFIISDWRDAGLNVPSYVRMHKLTVLSKTEILRRVGQLSVGDSLLFKSDLCRLFCPPIASPNH